MASPESTIRIVIPLVGAEPASLALIVCLPVGQAAVTVKVLVTSPLLALCLEVVDGASMPSRKKVMFTWLGKFCPLTWKVVPVAPAGMDPRA